MRAALVASIAIAACYPATDGPPALMAPKPEPAIEVSVSDFPPEPVIVAAGLTSRPANPTCTAPARPRLEAEVSLSLEPVFGDRGFQQAVWMTQAPGDTRWYVLERAGRVLRLEGDGSEVAEVFADLTEVVNSAPGHAGFLGMAFSPDYARTGEIFLSYTVGSWSNLESHVARYRVGPDGLLDPSSAELVLSLDQPSSPHNGGHIAFGPDGFLYIAFGDGQLGADQPNNALNPRNLLGTIVRIDVLGAAPYAIPPDNPLIGTDARAEIYALGFRNPWRFSFDRESGDLWLGDVGDADWEEINRVERGGNYAWPGREGAHCFRRRLGCEQPH